MKMMIWMLFSGLKRMFDFKISHAQNKLFIPDGYLLYEDGNSGCSIGIFFMQNGHTRW